MNYYNKNNRKEIVLVALLVAIIGMSLGFAAFSNTLSISSSASVTPNSDAFKVVFCDTDNIGNCDALNHVFIDYETSNGATTGDKVADVNGTVASDLFASFTSTNQSVVYKFYVQNIGQYDAYLRNVSYTPLSNGSYKMCSATTNDATKATDSLVQAACDGIKVTVSIGGTSYAFGSNISGHKLLKGTAEEVQVKFEYENGSALADGPFKVDISDFKFEYSTVDGSNLMSFTIDGTTYSAERGMTWQEWYDSSYNTSPVYIESDYICSNDLSNQIIGFLSAVIMEGKNYPIGEEAPCK